MMVAANGTNLKALGECDVYLATENAATHTRVVIVRGVAKNLLEKPQIQALDLLAFVNSVSEYKFEPIATFPNYLMFGNYAWSIHYWS